MDNIQPKRIGIDARFYGPLGKGLGRYTREIVDLVIKKDTLNEYVIFLGKENFDNFACDGIRVKKVMANVRWYSLSEQLIMPFYIFKNKIDLMHFPHFNVPVLCPTKFVVTIHDLILTKFPTPRATTLSPFLYKLKNFFYKIVVFAAVKRAKKIITVSNFTKEDIMRSFKVESSKIEVTYEGVADHINQGTCGTKDRGVVFKYGINGPFLLYVGNAYPHKNLERLVKTFGSPSSEMQLVLVGKEDYFYGRLKQSVSGDKIIFAGYVPDIDLKSFYCEALAYIFPSLYEGFGLPPLEAMANGCPVLSSDKASMPEILGDAALYFNPEDENEMKDKILKIISDENLRDNLIKKGYEQAKKFSWDECARKTVEVYREVL